MKHKNKLFGWMKNLLWLSFLSALAVFSISCEDDDEVANPYLQLGITTTTKNDSIIGSDYIYKVAKNGGSQYFFLNTNIGDWTLTPEEANQDWVVIWPAEGNNDGRFGVRVTANQQATTRKAIVYVIDSEGQVKGRLPIEQTGSSPSMEIDFKGEEKRISYVGETFTIGVTANIGWHADNGGTDWFRLGETTENSQEIIVDKHEELGERSGTLTFSMVGGNKTIAIRIIQSDYTTSYENASLISIADLLSSLSNGEGTVSDNVYIEAYVTSNIESKSIVSTSRTSSNFLQETKLMTVQDDSKRGLLFEFSKQEENIYKLNDKVKIHMYGVNFAKDPETGSVKAASFSPANVKEQVSGTEGIAPVELDNFDNLDQYENTLVKIKDVEFSLPYGGYVNIQETQFNTTTNWTATANLYSDDSSEFGHILRDKSGNLIKLYTPSSFTEMFVRTMPKGSGPLTAIVMKRIKNNVTSNILRIRNDVDNQISDDASTSLSTELMRIGPWDSNAPIAGISAAVGVGTLNQTSRPAQNVINSGGPDYIYWADAQIRANAQEATPRIYVLNNQAWWNTPASLLTDQPGEAWIITTSTAGSSATGKLFLQFMSSSSTSGPGIMTMEWAENAYTPAADWKAITDYYVCDVNNSRHLMEYCFELPDEVKDKTTLVIRLRAKENLRATANGSTIGGSGSNRIGAIRITQLKN